MPRDMGSGALLLIAFHHCCVGAASFSRVQNCCVRGGDHEMKTAIGFVLIAAFTALAAFNVTHGVNIVLGGICLAFIWVGIAGWMGGEPNLIRKTLPQIYQHFRQHGRTPLPALSKAIRAAALLLAIASVAYYFAH
jgi:hypothetical protein